MYSCILFSVVHKQIHCNVLNNLFLQSKNVIYTQEQYVKIQFFFNVTCNKKFIWHNLAKINYFRRRTYGTYIDGN